MFWYILLGLHLLGAVITFVYIWGKGIKVCIRVAFRLKPQYKIWEPFSVCRGSILHNLCRPQPEYSEVVVSSLAYGGMFSIIYPIYLPIYFVRQSLKIFIKTLAYKIVATKEEQVQRALGTDRPEKDDTSQRHQAVSGSWGKFYMGSHPPIKWKWGGT